MANKKKRSSKCYIDSWKWEFIH